MTPNETLIVQSCIEQTKQYHKVVVALLQLINFQLERENKLNNCSLADYCAYVNSTMGYVEPIISTLKAEKY